MEDNILIEAIERYARGEMSAEEKAYFEDLRKNTPEIDMMVVEHTMFLHQMDAYGQNKHFKHELHEVHNKLMEEGSISEGKASSGKVVSLWNRYRRVASIAASIAGITALLISGLVTYYTPVKDGQDLVLLKRKLDQVIHITTVQGNQINVLKSKVPVNQVASTGGTSFLVDPKGYLVTNAHVVAGSSTIIVQNNRGQEYKAVIAHLDKLRDLAILKIDDVDFRPLVSLPYGIRKSGADLGEQIFTLGYPRDEIVYNEGYMSAKTGFDRDTMTFQIAVSANPGNSGGPVLNRNGEVVGILSTAQSKAEGVVFAIKSRSIYHAIDELKKDTSYQKVKLAASASKLKGLDRVQQIKQIEDCVFMVRSFTK